MYEEIGYNCLNNMSESDYLERKVHNSKCRLYILTDVAMDFKFRPHVVNEIRDIQWFNVNELPVKMANVSNETFANKFYSVSPFIYSLRKWISREKKRRNKTADDKSRRTRYNSVGENAQKSDDSGTNSPYHMVENGPDIVQDPGNILSALFPSTSGTVQSEKEMHTRNVYHADLQKDLKSFTEKKNWPEVWQSLVNHYNNENDEEHSSKIDYDLKSKLSASSSTSSSSSSSTASSCASSSFITQPTNVPLATLFPGLNNSCDNSSQILSKSSNLCTLTTGPEHNLSLSSKISFNNHQPDTYNDKLNFLFNIASGEKKNLLRSGASTPIQNDAVRKLFSSPDPNERLNDSKMLSPSLFSRRSSTGFDNHSLNGDNSKGSSSYTSKGLSNHDAQALCEPMAKLLNLLNSKRG